MRLVVRDQIHISSVRSDTLHPGEVFEVSDVLGRELLAKHPQGLAAPEDEGEAVEIKPAGKRRPKTDEPA